MKVDGKYYFDQDISDTVDAMMKRHSIKLDNLIVVTGREGSGKSSFAIGLCWLYAKRMGIKFNVDDITFSAQEFLQRTTMRKDGIVLYDEAVQGLMTTQWQNRAQQMIIQALMMARKNRNLYVLCIPSFEYLNKYIATERSYLLFDCYMKDNRRGFAQMFSSKVPNQLKLLYHQCKSLSPNRMTSKWKIRFLDHSEEFIDKNAYEAKKDKAIQKLTQSLQVDPVSPFQRKYYQLLAGIDIPTKEIASILGLTDSAIRKAKKVAKTYVAEQEASKTGGST